MTEEWRSISGFEGKYEVSNLGRIRKIIATQGSRPGVLRPYVGSDGYLYVDLYKGGKRYRKLVHRLVAEAFLGHLPPGKVVNHKDHDRTNARVSNLEYVTISENNADAARFGSVGKLTVEDVRAIRASHESHSALARRYGVTKQAIMYVRSRRTWAHVS
ncbi:MAG: hypothetical protein CW346_14925 [Bacillaceae bacterium]|nr:hypothetical protein [Bacillaceae bacterium]